MDVEEGGHPMTGTVWNVELEKVDENQLDWTPIQSRGYGHGGWKPGFKKTVFLHPTRWSF